MNYEEYGTTNQYKIINKKHTKGNYIVWFSEAELIGRIVLIKYMRADRAENSFIL